MIRLLAWLGRRGAHALAALLFIGIAVPPLGAVLKPFVTEAVFVLLSIAFIQLDTGALRAHLGRPAVALAGTAWTVLAVPALFGGACLATGMASLSPELFLALVLQGVASPMMSGPAVATLIGLDATLVLITLVASTALVPLTAPFFAWAFAGPALTFSPAALGVKLMAILAGAALVAAIVRRLAGLEAIARHRDEINGVNVVVLFIFVAAIMENVAASTFRAPLVTAGLLALALALFYGLLALTLAVFVRAGRARALALAFMASQRNLGLMLAATGGALPDLVWLYFALAQFPIYLAPLLVGPLARRLGAGADRPERHIP